VLDPRSRQRDGRSSREGGKGKPWINVNPAEDFDPITKIEKVPFDPVEHAKYAVRVRRASQQMKRYLERLGARLVPQRMRVSGRRLDPPRTKALVVRGDPRVLVARSIQIRTDLFLGVIIDCSGSMQGSRIERAKLFGTMLAEAAKGVPGVDVRIFGFTHKVIFDAGDAQHCAAHALEATDGNNDAAALWHVAQVARASARRAKLLVMISDGLPTECSVAALRGLVTKLGQRWGICCAQVAVAPIAEVCFPHYVLLEDEDGGVAVRKFGEVIARLVLRAMART